MDNNADKPVEMELLLLPNVTMATSKVGTDAPVIVQLSLNIDVQPVAVYLLPSVS